MRIVSIDSEHAVPGRKRRNTARQQTTIAGMYILLMALAMIFVAPFLWLVITALKDPSELNAFPIHWLPARVYWNNFIQAVTMVNFAQYMLNSLTLATLYTVFVTISSSLVGFGFARFQAKGKKVLFIVMLATLMLPSVLTVIPTYMLFSHLQLLNSYWPWVLWGCASSPFLSFLFRQFFSSIPRELEEAAILDGCSYARIFWQIFLPLSKPVIVTSVILSFTWVWGDFFSQSLFLNQNTTTLAVVVSTAYTDPYGSPLLTVIAAGAVLYVLPVMLVFVFAQRFFVRGIVTSGLKG
jgi:multiple sugar transport system permease protein